MKTVDVVGWLVGVKCEKEKREGKGRFKYWRLRGVIALKLKISDDWGTSKFTVISA